MGDADRSGGRDEGGGADAYRIPGLEPSTSGVRWSLAILILVNLIPILGFVAYGWDPLRLLLLYWCESAVMIGFAVARMWLVPATPSIGVEGPMTPASGGAGRKRKIFMSVFLCVHSGIFMAGHLFFLTFLAAAGHRRGLLNPGSRDTLDRLRETVTDGSVLLVLFGFVASHLFSYVVHYWHGGEYRRTTLSQEMGRPYSRIFVMHIAIIFGAFGMVLAGLPASSLVVLVVVKTAIDAVVHLRDHRKKQLLASA